MSNYRAWDILAKTMCHVSAIDFKNGLADICAGGLPAYTRSLGYLELMQSTGIKDRHGREIFEKDIVKPVSFATWIGVVEYNPETASHILNDRNDDFPRESEVFLSQFADGLEVLGNIFENRDLLKKKEAVHEL